MCAGADQERAVVGRWCAQGGSHHHPHQQRQQQQRKVKLVVQRAFVFVIVVAD